MFAKKLFGAGGEDRYQLWPERALRSTMDSLSLPHDVMTGKIDPTSDEAIAKSVDLALLHVGAPYANLAKEGMLDQAGMVALRDYAQTGYQALNKHLNGVSTPLMDRVLSSAKATLLDRLVEKEAPLEGPMTVFRGGGRGLRMALEDFKVGDEITFPSFTSTSKSKNVATDFMSSTGGIRMAIHLPSGSKALDMTKRYPGAMDEFEMLLPRNSRFRVESHSIGKAGFDNHFMDLYYMGAAT
jgi:hypothetical protein